MRAPITPLEFLQPRSLEDALRRMRGDDPPIPLAGCTDLYVLLNAGTPPGSRFLNLWGLRGLHGIRTRGRVLSIGALTTYTEIIASPLVRRRIPMLADASREVGGVQIQNRGTLGGNVANASPAGDTLPVLAAADATIVLQSTRGTRRVPMAGYYTGYRASVRRPDELIVAIEIPPLPARQWFRKVGTRAAQAISKVVMAVVGGDRPRIAFGSVAPTVVRVPRTEDALAGGAPLAEAQRILGEEIAPIDDARSTGEYRRQVAVNLLGEWHARWRGR